MKSLFSLLFLFLISVSANAQEFSSTENLSFFDKSEDFTYVGKKEVVPSLSFLAPEVPSQNLTLTEINWNPIEKREVNFVAMMEREKIELQNSYIELDSPAPTIGKTEKSVIQITNDFRHFDKGSNYDLFTGQKKIPAYEEMRPGLFRGNYSPYSNRSGFSPYYYSPLR